MVRGRKFVGLSIALVMLCAIAQPMFAAEPPRMACARMKMPKGFAHDCCGGSRRELPAKEKGQRHPVMPAMCGSAGASGCEMGGGVRTSDSQSTVQQRFVLVRNARVAGTEAVWVRGDSASGPPGESFRKAVFELKSDLRI